MSEFRTSRSGREYGITSLASLGTAGDMGEAPAIATRAIATTRSCVWGAGSVLKTKCLNPTEWQFASRRDGLLARMLTTTVRGSVGREAGAEVAGSKSSYPKAARQPAEQPAAYWRQPALKQEYSTILPDSATLPLYLHSHFICGTFPQRSSSAPVFAAEHLKRCCHAHRPA